MILAADIGNTTISLGGLERVGDDYQVRFRFKTATAGGWHPLEDIARLGQLLVQHQIPPETMEGAVLSSVVPTLTGALKGALQQLTGREPLLVTPGLKTGLRFAVPEPDKIGLDRVADAAWAAARFPLPAVTVDLGTAATFNVVDEGGVFLGGVIAPGPATSLGALSRQAAQLPALELAGPGRLIGRDTRECMLSGVVAGTAAMVDGLTAGIERELGKPVTLILTGGNADLIASFCQRPYILVPDLLFKGLAWIYTQAEQSRL